MSYSISFDEIGAVVATFAAEVGVAPGAAVVLTDAGTVGMGAAGKKICGVALAPSPDGFAGVQVSGFARVKTSGAAIAAGWADLTSDGAGGVKKAASGDEAGSYLAVQVDATAHTAVILL